MINQSCSEPQYPQYFSSKSSQHNSLKFSQLKSSLINCDIDFIINLLIQQLEKTDKLQLQLKQMDRLLKLVEDEKQHLKITLADKKQAFKQVCQTQQKNVENIEMLEKELFHMRHKFQLSKEQTQVHETAIEKKYRELSKCMNQYVANTADIQEEFKMNFFILKNENIRLHAENENINLSYKEQMITLTVLSKEVENAKMLHHTVGHMKSENERLLKQLYYHQQVQKELYEGVAFIETERVGLEKELEKVKEICQSSNTTNIQISGKYEELLQKYREQEKERSIIADNCKGSTERIRQLETCIIKQQEEYQHMGSEIEKLKRLNIQFQQNNIELLTQTAGLQKRLIQSQTDTHNLTEQNSILRQKLSFLEEKNKELKELNQRMGRQKDKQRGKSDLICIQIQNFLNQPHALLKSSSSKPMRDLTNIRSSKTMATSTSQSRVDKMNEENIKPQ